MTEEIKQILEALKPHNEVKEYPLILSLEQQKILLDYITNLQQENETLKEELKNRPIVDFTFDVYKELEDYKSRFKKVNEWIGKHQQTIENMRKEKFYILNLGIDDTKEFKNILNGSDKE